MPAPVKGKRTSKQRAKPGAGVEMPQPYKPPTPAERMKSSVEYASHDAAMAHPQVKRIRKGIHRQMMKAARGAGFQTPGGGGGLRNVRSF